MDKPPRKTREEVVRRTKVKRFLELLGELEENESISDERRDKIDNELSAISAESLKYLRNRFPDLFNLNTIQIDLAEYEKLQDMKLNGVDQYLYDKYDEVKNMEPYDIMAVIVLDLSDPDAFSSQEQYVGYTMFRDGDGSETVDSPHALEMGSVFYDYLKNLGILPYDAEKLYRIEEKSDEDLYANIPRHFSPDDEGYWKVGNNFEERRQWAKIELLRQAVGISTQSRNIEDD